MGDALRAPGSQTVFAIPYTRYRGQLRIWADGHDNEFELAHPSELNGPVVKDPSLMGFWVPLGLA